MTQTIIPVLTVLLMVVSVFVADKIQSVFGIELAGTGPVLLTFIVFLLLGISLQLLVHLGQRTGKCVLDRTTER